MQNFQVSTKFNWLNYFKSYLALASRHNLWPTHEENRKHEKVSAEQARFCYFQLHILIAEQHTT